jgi:lipoic acid synthetase
MNTDKQRAKDKLSRIPIKIDHGHEPLPKPPWLKIRLSGSSQPQSLIDQFKSQKLNTVCQEASCPNLNECFSKGTATFMIMGDRCTRRCSFCDVAHGRPDPLDIDEPKRLAETIKAMQLKYVVITSVDRDDLRDGGAAHFVACDLAIRAQCPDIQLEWLVPDFRGRWDKALSAFADSQPNVFNHNLETTKRLYKQARPGSDYQWSLDILKSFKSTHPNIPTKSGIMVGLGETDEEVIQCMQDLVNHDVDMITIGQYLAPSRYHLPVARYVHPDTFKHYEKLGYDMGFKHVASGPFVRSSYHADKQASGEVIS